jgi:hypothetical protein
VGGTCAGGGGGRGGDGAGGVVSPHRQTSHSCRRLDPARTVMRGNELHVNMMSAYKCSMWYGCGMGWDIMAI